MGSPRNIPKPPPAALLTHSPGPGLYSRLERAIESLPPEVKVEGLENRLRKYPEGVGSFEVTPFLEGFYGSDLGSTKSVKRSDLLDLVHSKSPVFGHTEGMLQGPDFWPTLSGYRQGYAAGGPLGDARHIGGATNYTKATENYGFYPSGVGNYRQFLLMASPQWEPMPIGKAKTWQGGHWGHYPDTIAHARTIDAGDALRVQEIQSDLRNQIGRAEKRGHPLPYERSVLNDEYVNIFAKSLLLRAAREGKRAIEMPALDAPPRYTNMSQAGSIHHYGGVVPGAFIKAGRPLGGLVQEPGFVRADTPRRAIDPEILRQLSVDYADAAARRAGLHAELRKAGGFPVGTTPRLRLRALGNALNASRFDDYGRPVGTLDGQFTGPDSVWHHTNHVLDRMTQGTQDARRLAKQRMPQVMRLAQELAHAETALRNINNQYATLHAQYAPATSVSLQAPSQRLVIPDAVRRRILEGGIGLSLLQGLMTEPQPAQEQQ